MAAFVHTDGNGALSVGADANLLLDATSLPKGLKAGIAALIGVSGEADIALSIGCDGAIRTVRISGKVTLAGVTIPTGRAIVITPQGVTVEP